MDGFQSEPGRWKVPGTGFRRLRECDGKQRINSYDSSKSGEHTARINQRLTGRYDRPVADGKSLRLKPGGRGRSDAVAGVSDAHKGKENEFRYCRLYPGLREVVVSDDTKFLGFSDFAA